MIVHRIALRLQSAQVTGGLVALPEQPVEPAPDGIVIFASAVVVGFAATVEREQRERGGGNIVPFLAAVFADVPASVLLLDRDEIRERLVDRRLALRRAAEFRHHILLGERALAQRIEHAQLAFGEEFERRVGGDLGGVDVEVDAAVAYVLELISGREFGGFFLADADCGMWAVAREVEC